MNPIKCEHSYQATGYIQISWLGTDKEEQEEYKCKHCPKRI
jgi:hypothetical protein